VELAWPSAAAPVTVTACLEGSEASLAERADELGSVLADALPRRALSGPARGWVPSESDAVPVVADDPPPWWGATGPARGTVLRVAFWAGRLARVLTAIRAAAAPVGLDPSISGSGGVLHVALPAGAPAAAVARFVPALRAALAGLAEPGTAGPPAQASAVVLHAPPPVRDVVDLFGPVPALPLMRAVKDRFDPEDRLSPGRLAGL
jgi:glycolate oxidase FAD binding subunit